MQTYPVESEEENYWGARGDEHTFPCPGSKILKAKGFFASQILGGGSWVDLEISTGRCGQ